MADKAPKLDAIKDLKWLGLILLGLFILWYFTGGPQRYDASKPFLNPPVQTN